MPQSRHGKLATQYRQFIHEPQHSSPRLHPTNPTASEKMRHRIDPILVIYHSVLVNLSAVIHF
jgi:hypothetical protein